MIQSIDKQLQVVIRALTEVVSPGLAGADKHVAEQLQLSIATLAFVAKRLPEARRYYRWEMSAYLDMAQALTAAASEGADGELDRFLADGAAVLARPEADLADYEQVARVGREAIAAFAEASRSLAVERLILDRSEAIIAQQRQWTVQFGFELRPETLPAAAW